MTRIRPRLEDYKKARDFDWYEANSEWFESLGNRRWQVFATLDVYDHRVHSEHESLVEAIKVARWLSGGESG